MTITHNLEVAKPNFLYFINNMTPEISRWIQYRGVTVDGSRILFDFKSSQNSLSFSVYAGVNVGNTEDVLLSKSTEIYDYFRTLKYDTITI